MLFHITVNWKGAPRWRAPPQILDIDETGVTVKFQFQTFRVARYRVRQTAEGIHGKASWEDANSGTKGKEMGAEEDGEDKVTSTGIP